MQHHLSSQFETMWAIADLVATHGQHDFGVAGDGMSRVVTHCGMTVYLYDQLPVRFSATDLDLTVDRQDQAQSYETWLQMPNMRDVHALANARYTLNFRRGSVSTLRAWLDRLHAFEAATSIPRAA